MHAPTVPVRLPDGSCGAPGRHSVATRKSNKICKPDYQPFADSPHPTIAARALDQEAAYDMRT